MPLQVSRAKLAIIRAVLEADELNMVDTLQAILAVNKLQVSTLAKRAGVSRQTFYNVLNGRARSEPVRQAIVKVLGFDPWAGS